MSAAPAAAVASWPATGRALMEGIRDGAVDPPPAAVLFGLEVLEVGDGTITFGFRPAERYSNWRTTHGGVLAGLADFALTTAVWTVLPATAGVVTTNLTVTYLRPLHLDAGPARVEGELVHLGRTLAHGEVTLRGEDGTVLLRASGTCRVVRDG